MQKIIKKNFLIFLLFCIIAFLFFYKIFPLKGAILGGDWSLPYSNLQIKKALFNNVFTWNEMNFGARNTVSNSLFFYFAMYLFSFLGINGAIFEKLFLLITFSLSGFFFFRLMKFFKCSDLSSFISGIVYMTTPLLFDYTILGWIYVLIIISLLPLIVKYFIRSVKNDDLKDRILVSLLITISIQSQAIIWCYLIFLGLFFYLVKNKKTFLIYLKSFFMIMILFILFNFFWLAPLIFFPDINISGNSIVKSNISLGTTTNFHPINIIRLYGASHNYQYEYIMSDSPFLIFSSFFLIFLAVLSFLDRKNKKLVKSFFLILIIPFIIYIGQNFIRYFPMSNVIRDLARFSVISSFVCPVLVGFSLNFLFKKNNLFFKILTYSLLLGTFFSLYPWWSGKIFDYQYDLGKHQRLRVKDFPRDYFDFDYFFSRKKLLQKVIYFPISVTIEFNDDSRFFGDYQEAIDIFSMYSSVGGPIFINDRSISYSDEFVRRIRNISYSDISDLLENRDIGFIVIRKNLTIENLEFLISSFEDNQDWKIFFESENIIAFSKKTNSIFPLFWIKNNINDEESTMEIKKINPIKYRIVFHNVKNNFMLIFNESFHNGWRIYLKNLQKNNGKFDLADKYFIFNENELTQASKEELNSYINTGLISNLGDNKKKITNYFNWNDDQPTIYSFLNYQIDFISKRIKNTIQNNNLDDGFFYETWFQKTIANDSHEVFDDYANSWQIDPILICNNNAECSQNSDGSYNFELVVEFWPQRLYYMGAIISLGTLISCVSCIINKKNIKNEKNN